MWPTYPEMETIEIPQRNHISKADFCLKVHNVHLKLVMPISGKDKHFIQLSNSMIVNIIFSMISTAKPE